MITVLLVLLGATMRIIAPYLPGNREQLTDGFDGRSVARHLRASIDSRIYSVSLSLRRETCEYVHWQLRAAS